MKIGQMFAKSIDRDLKGVIKVGQDDDFNIQQELEEYVVTRELQKHFRDFFDSYKRGIQGNTDKMGVWISGFFGSGKSHFLKILSYLLENKVVNGKTALEYFEEDQKIKDPMVLADMRLAASVPTDVILFNIDSKSEQSGKRDKDAIVNVFLKVFNEMQGFCGAIPFLADLERNLSEKGRYEEFKERYEASFDSKWTESRNDFDFIQDDIVEVLVDMKFMSEEAARNWCERATTDYAISIERLSDLVKKYIERKGNNHHVVFLVDEIGQYIGDNSDLMLNLQTVTEDLGQACDGKAWIIVTSQQDIDSVTKTKGNDFSKIQGRFDTRLSLSSANVDEVIRERVLKKTDAATQALSLYYDEKETIIKNLILFNDGVEKKLYADRANFAAVYPFIPYQFNLLGHVLTSIRTHGASGKHLAEGERSMLALFKESAVRVMNEEDGAVVPFHMFYNALEQFLDHSHKGVISRALENDYLNPNHEEECFDVNVLKTLFMIKYVKEIKANVENLTSLMISHIDDDRMALSKKVEEALKRLVGQTLVQKNGEVYVFLTNEEQDINHAIKNQAVDVGEVTAKVSELIFDGLFDVKKYRYPAFSGRYAFGFNQIVDDKPYKAGQHQDITLKILTPNSDEIADETTLRLLSSQENYVLVVLGDDRAFLDEIATSLQIEKFLRFDATNTVTKYEQIKEAKKVEMRERNDAARVFLEEALKSATIYVNGDRVQTSVKDISGRINEALGKLVTNVYHKLSYIDTPMGESDIKKLLTEKEQQMTLSGTDRTPNSSALYDVKDYIAQSTARHLKISMKSLLDRFMKAPYGFVEADVQWLVAKLFKDGEIALTVNSEPVSLLTKSVDDIVRFITRKEFNERLMAEKRIRATDKQKKIAREVLKELFGRTAVGDEDDVIMKAFHEEAATLKSELENLELRYYDKQSHYPGKDVVNTGISTFEMDVNDLYYPGKDVVNTGKKLMNDVMQLKDANAFFASIDDKQDDYLDFAEDFEPVKTFFKGEQVKLFDKAMEYMKIYEDSRTYIVNEDIEKSAADIQAILKKTAPYSDIKKLPGLIEQFTDAHNDLLTDMEKPVLDAVNEAKERVFQELTGKLCEDTLKDAHSKRFRDLREKAKSCNNVALLQNIKFEADTLKIRCLKEIADKEATLLAQKANEEAKQQGQSADSDQQEGDVTSPAPKVKAQRVVSIKSINTETTWQLESVDDVKRYMAELEKKLLAQLEEDTVLHVEF